MKIAYVSYPALSDADISYLSCAQNRLDIHYYIVITPNTRRGAAIDIITNKEFGIYCANDFPELIKYKNILNLNNTFIVNMTYKKGMFMHGIIQNIKFYQHIRANNYSVVHATWPFTYNGFIFYLLRNKMILTMHDPFPHSSLVSKIRLFERNVAISLVKNFILLNKTQYDDFVYAYKKRKKNIFVSKLSRYDYLNIYNCLNAIINEPYILFFGQIQSHKGIEFLLEAMLKTHEKYPDVVLIIAGSGKYYFDTSKYLQLPFIKFINRFIKDEELASLIKYSKFVVAPYCDATQSGVVMSSFAFNKPCIVTNVGALPEIVVNNKYGIVVPPKDVLALNNAINYLIENDSIVSKMSNNIADDYSNGEMSWCQIAMEMERIYNEV